MQAQPYVCLIFDLWKQISNDPSLVLMTVRDECVKRVRCVVILFQRKSASRLQQVQPVPARVELLFPSKM